MYDNFLPINQNDLKKRGRKDCDIVIVSGEAYVDHPSFGVSVISRLLEKNGFSVGIISQPDWRSLKDFLVLGQPKLFFGVTSGCLDSMVANYTANKRLRINDDYSPAGKAGLRPDRALIVYSNRIREAFGKIPIVLGGVEASLRRLAHYDYWDNSVRRSVLVDSKADILVYGMAERQILEIANRLKQGQSMDDLNDIRGTVINRKDFSFLKESIQIPSFEEVKLNNDDFNKAFKLIYEQQSPAAAKPIIQKHADRFIIQLPLVLPLTANELDEIYDLPFCRNYHPKYEKYGGVPALETVRFSITSHRGCCGQCNFCSLYMHQGRIVVSRSQESILREAKVISQQKYFRGTITDVAGPTANLYAADCSLWKNNSCCQKNCLVPSKCENLKLGYNQSLEVYRKIKEIPKVKHVFIASGFRFDLLADNHAQNYLKAVMNENISGYMKIAPEHICGNVLEAMNKSSKDKYEKFLKNFDDINRHSKRKSQLVNYFICSHPGASLKDALDLALYVKRKHLSYEQAQDFIPLPMTVSSCIYYTGRHPSNGKRYSVAKTFKERKMQRALLQYKNTKNTLLVREALEELNAKALLREFK